MPGLIAVHFGHDSTCRYPDADHLSHAQLTSGLVPDRALLFVPGVREPAADRGLGPWVRVVAAFRRQLQLGPHVLDVQRRAVGIAARPPRW